MPTTVHRHARRDPLANSFIAALTEDPAADHRLASEDYERSAEEDEEFGIDHLKLHDGDGSAAANPQVPAAAAARGAGDNSDAAAEPALAQ